MSDNVIELVPCVRAGDEGLVEKLEMLLEMARSGELASFCGAGMLANGNPLTVAGPTPNIYLDIAAVNLLHRYLIDDVLGDC